MFPVAKHPKISCLLRPVPQVAPVGASDRELEAGRRT